MSEDFFNQEETNEFEFLIRKFDTMIRNQNVGFFDVDDFSSIIEYYLDNGMTDKAYEALKVAMSQHPNSHDIQVKHAEYLYVVGRLNKALDILLKATQYGAAQEEVYLLIAAIYSQQREHKKSISYFDKALTFEVEDRDEILVDQAIEYENLKDYPTAIKKLKEALAENPENEAAAYELSYCYSMVDKAQEAVAFFQSFVDENPYSFSGWYNLGMCQAKANDIEKAINAFDYCILIDRSISLPYHQKAMLQVESEDFQGALETYKECLEFDENSSALYSYIGECYEKLGKLTNAMEHYRKALKLNEQQADAWLGIGIIKDLEGLPHEALPYLKKAVSLQPESPDYWFILGEAYRKVEQHADAEKCYKNVVELEPENVYAWLDYSNLAEETQTLEDALMILEDALAFNPDNVKLIYRKAVYLIKNGEWKEAATEFSKALSLDFEEHTAVFEYYPEAKNIALLHELIDLHKKDQ